MKTAATIETAIAKRDAAAKPAAGQHVIAMKYSGDTVVKPLDAVVTNLASPCGHLGPAGGVDGVQERRAAKTRR